MVSSHPFRHHLSFHPDVLSLSPPPHPFTFYWHNVSISAAGLLASRAAWTDGCQIVNLFISWDSTQRNKRHFTSLEQYCSERYTRLFHSTMLNSIYYLKTLLELYYHALLTTRGRHKRYTMCTGRDRKEKSLFTAHIF